MAKIKERPLDDTRPLDDFVQAYSCIHMVGISIYIGVSIEEETPAHRPFRGTEFMQWNLWVGDDDDDDED